VGLGRCLQPALELTSERGAPSVADVDQACGEPAMAVACES
jgi:hypothetical protein